MKITFLGGGNMANALIGGLLNQGFAAEDIKVVELNSGNREKLTADFGIACLGAPEASAWECDVIVLAVKPQQMRGAIGPIVPYLGDQLVVSIAAGLGLETLSRWLKGHRRIVRCMPNTPALIGAGITGLCALSEVGLAERAAAEKIMKTVGSTLWLEDEGRMDAVTAVSGSGPAYVFLFIEALQQAAAELGLTAEQGRQLAVETVLGAAKLADVSPEPAALLRERVTSKGGTTEAALRVMGERGVKEGIVAGAHAAEARGRELGRQLGESN